MLVSADLHPTAKSRLEQFEFGLAQALASRGRFADRTMVFDQEPTIPVGGVDDLGHVALVGPQIGQSAELVVDPAQSTPVLDQLIGEPLFDDGLKAVIAHGGPDRTDERDGEIGMTIGEQIEGHGGERPLQRRPSRSRCRPTRRLDEPIAVEIVEVLANGFRGQPKARRELRPGQGTTLQRVDDPSLRRRECG